MMLYKIFSGPVECASYMDMNSVSLWLSAVCGEFHIKVYALDDLIDTVRSRDWAAYVELNRDDPKHTMYSPTFGMYIKE